MSTADHKPAPGTCCCSALRQASRAVSRLYDEVLRSIGLRATQYSVLRLLRRSGEVWQRDLAGLTLHNETSLTRSLRPLEDACWLAVRAGDDRREKWFTITAEGLPSTTGPALAWERAQARFQSLLPEGPWPGLMEILQKVARRTTGSWFFCPNTCVRMLLPGTQASGFVSRWSDGDPTARSVVTTREQKPSDYSDRLALVRRMRPGTAHQTIH
jgi:hypothetical protein